jgi:phenylalanyl-tRNA synthetase beta chain
MKLLLSWILDHVYIDREIAYEEIINKISRTTAEIEQTVHSIIPVENFAFVCARAHDEQGLVVEDIESGKEYRLPNRAVQLGSHYLIYKENNAFRWATTRDLGSEKNFLLPALLRPQGDTNAWRDQLQHEDWIIHIDNKSISHRPDLWSHRGFAREIAAHFNFSLKSEDNLLGHCPIKHYPNKAAAQPSMPYSLEMVPHSPVKRLAGMYIADIKSNTSPLFYAQRLAKIDIKPISALVDATNYVMLDIGQPLHAFDTELLTTNSIVVGYAKPGQHINLHDDQKIKLTSQDCVVSDGGRPLVLAGIMGGKDAAIHEQTHNALIIAENLEASAIRSSSTRHKLRTESSARFEKVLDPNQNTVGLLRFIKVLHDMGLVFKKPEAIPSLGALSHEVTIEISKDFIVKRLGTQVSSDTIESKLTALGFGVLSFAGPDGDYFKITVPTIRATKDISRLEDIVEEVGRSIGYDSIQPVMPNRVTKPVDTTAIDLVNVIKEHAAMSVAMHEVSNYALYDEEWLNQLGYFPTNAPLLKNPLSDARKRLVTSLVPHLLKNVTDNNTRYDKLRFFEINKIWHEEQQVIKEALSFGGVMYDQKSLVNFYDCKNDLQTIFDAIDILIEWRKPATVPDWAHPYETAELFANSQSLGYAGMLNAKVSSIIGRGTAFVFELNVDTLRAMEPLKRHFAGILTYQPVTLDVSMLIDRILTATEIESIIAYCDARVLDVQLLDFFEKPEWGSKRSITMRYILYDDQKTMTKSEIDEIQESVHKALKKYGAEIR